MTRAAPSTRYVLLRPVLLGPVLLGMVLLGGCGPAGDDATPEESRPERSFQMELADEQNVWLSGATAPRVVAYVSMDRLEVYVDRQYRDRASWLLNAHISVSTWHWRIPLPGDDPGIPITPGDEEREFEELDISLWHRGPPSIDDIRIVLADTVSVDFVLDCAPVAREGEALWLSGRAGFVASEPSESTTVREDFRSVGTADVFSGAECSEQRGSVGLVGWTGSSGR